MLCVYAIVSATRRRIGVRGCRGETLRPFAAGPVAAVVGAHARAPRPTRTSLRAYHASVERLAHALPAIVPVRFGTTFETDEELAFVLRTRAPTFSRMLRHVRYRLQMTVRVVLDEDELTPDVAIDRRSGAAYLRSRSAQSARPSRRPAVAAVRHAVRRWVRDEQVEQRGRVVTIYHLVPRGSVDAYRRAVRRAGSAQQLVVAGPFAPYAFAERPA